jgi:hypothetical protein
MNQRVFLLMWCLAIGLFAYVTLDFYSSRNIPLYKKFEKQWQHDVQILEASGKLPKAWFNTGEIVLTGGTPDSRAWLQRIKHPLRQIKDGKTKMEVLVIAWEENGKTGVTLQYNLSDRATGEWIKEVGRTLILADKAKPANNADEFIKELKF